jgi:chromosomal replication initiator protein
VGDAQELWTRCRDYVRRQVPPAVWFSTFQDVEPVAVSDGRLVLGAPSVMVKQRLDGQYRTLLEAGIGAAGSGPIELAVEVRAHTGGPPGGADPLDAVLGQPTGQAYEPMPPPRALPSRRHGDGTEVFPFTFDGFVTGPSNRFACAAALRVAETPGREYNPLFIYGDSGLGKTHLLRAIGHYVAEHYPSSIVTYLSSERFLNEFVDSIRSGTGTSFKRRFRAVDVLLVDDIQFIEKAERFQEEFFHTFNELHERNSQIVLTSDRRPDAIPTLESRLKSRFRMGLITDIQPPDIETRLAILRKKAEREPTPVPAELLEFIATHVTDNIRELEGALNRVSAHAHIYHRDLTVEEAERVLSDVIGDRQPVVITPKDILNATADLFGLTVEELKHKSRQRPLVIARQVGMYVMRELTDLSYPAIGREFGNRDHTTVMHAERKIADVMKERQQVYHQVTELLQRLKKGT